MYLQLPIADAILHHLNYCINYRKFDDKLPQVLLQMSWKWTVAMVDGFDIRALVYISKQLSQRLWCCKRHILVVLLSTHIFYVWSFDGRFGSFLFFPFLVVLNFWPVWILNSKCAVIHSWKYVSNPSILHDFFFGTTLFFVWCIGGTSVGRSMCHFGPPTYKNRPLWCLSTAERYV